MQSSTDLISNNNSYNNGTHQISNIGYLYSVMDDFQACAAIPPIEHGLIDDERRLDVLRGLSHVAPAPIERAQICIVPPTPCSVFSFFPVEENMKNLVVVLQ